MEFYAANLLNAHWGESITLKPDNSLEISMVSAGLSGADCEAAFKPFFDWVDASPAKFSFTDDKYAGASAARAWWDAVARAKRGSKAMTSDDRPGSPPTHAWWKGDQEQVGAYLYGYDSLWLPQSLLQNENRERMTDALIAASRHVPAMLHFNKGLAGAPMEAVEAARNTATNPDVLNAFALAIVAAGGASRYSSLPGAPSDVKEPAMGARAVDLAMVELRKLAPNGGSYVSESNYFNANWSKNFWGANYARLRAVKQKYDPEGLFFVHHGVGSEEWSADGFRHL